MDAECGFPDAEALREALAGLDRIGFPSTSRLPLFAARHWSPAMERRALERFRRGLCNVEEVAIPRWYWRRLSPSLQSAFRSLCLGTGPNRSGDTATAPLFKASGEARWRVVSRFSRYVLHSRPEVADDSLVYFGDDTLFLMQAARQRLQGLRQPVRVLDLCCGGGGVGLGLPHFKGELLGVDINPTAVGLACLAASAQGLSHYSYLCGDAASALLGQYDLIVGNPPTLPPDLGGQTTLYATGSSSGFLGLLERMLDVLSPRGEALLTVFSTATGLGVSAADGLRTDLGRVLNGRRGHRYSIRRQFPLGGGRWLRHVALQIHPEGVAPQGEFQDASGGFQLPALHWRR